MPNRDRNNIPQGIKIGEKRPKQGMNGDNVVKTTRSKNL